ncbi:MAG: 50S ribosomal protein L29 [Candidatus Bathyarchaeia archaeon]|nr:MAG: 50S ribosomal protein L29 [Candidatus Bathyarchaeota archaeon]
MPTMRIKEIREMSSDDRMKKLRELKTELVRLKTMIKAGGTVENPAMIRELRKTIARILTIEKEERSKRAKAEKERKKEK